jgi:hypothetical protein
VVCVTVIQAKLLGGILERSQDVTEIVAAFKLNV